MTAARFPGLTVCNYWGRAEGSAPYSESKNKNIMNESRKHTLRTILKLVITIATAIASAVGVTSCIR